jgi:hypothetical protein
VVARSRDFQGGVGAHERKESAIGSASTPPAFPQPSGSVSIGQVRPGTCRAGID